MAASEMAFHCGLDQWTRNSQVVVATSQAPLTQEFTSVAPSALSPLVPLTTPAVLSGPFSHEPDLIRGPGGELVAFYTHATTPVPPGGPVCMACTNGSSTPECDRSVINPYAHNVSGRAFPTFMRWAALAAPAAPAASLPALAWSDPVELFNATAGQPRGGTYGDTNLAATILKNGSLVGIWRECSRPNTWATVHAVTATNWKDPASYDWHASEELFVPSSQPGQEPGRDLPPPPEDPFVWGGPDGDEGGGGARAGVFHALFHDRGGNGGVGSHVWSADGLRWTYTGVAYGFDVAYTDGTRETFARRERPHLIFDASRTPIALTTGVTMDHSLTGDYSYTHLQPIGR